jgi:acyl-CoA reductase-like NAD-dependent aldehyde dehydrogenase
LGVEAAEAASPTWAETPGPRRGALLFRFAQLLEERKAELAKIITIEQGKARSLAHSLRNRAAKQPHVSRPCFRSANERLFGNT